MKRWQKIVLFYVAVELAYFLVCSFIAGSFDIMNWAVRPIAEEPSNSYLARFWFVLVDTTLIIVLALSMDKIIKRDVK